MAVENYLSAQLTNKAAGVTNAAPSGKAELFSLYFQATPGAGDTNSTIAIVDLPPGTYRYVGDLSRIYHSAFGTGRTMDVGFDAYVTEAGATVSADEDGLHSAADVASAGSFQPLDELTTHPVGSKLFSSVGGIRFRCKVEGAGLSAGEEMSGWLTFMK